MRNSESSPDPVIHEPNLSRFSATLDGFVSVAEYECRGDRMIFTHTFVPPELRGRGLAEKLVRAGLELAREKGLKVVPACSYVAAFIQRRPEYLPLVAD